MISKLTQLLVLKEPLKGVVQGQWHDQVFKAKITLYNKGGAGHPAGSCGNPSKLPRRRGLGQRGRERARETYPPASKVGWMWKVRAETPGGCLGLWDRPGCQ